MPLEKLNAALIGAIQNSTPEYTNAAAILTDKLNIGREAAYRRLRGEVPFTFGEAGVLSAQMNFSLDRTVGALDFGNVLFRLSSVITIRRSKITRGLSTRIPFSTARFPPTSMPNRPSPEIRFRGCFTCVIRNRPISNFSNGSTSRGSSTVRGLNSRI